MNNIKKIIIYTLFFSVATTHAAELTVYNQTDTDKNVTVWYYDQLKKLEKHKGPFQVFAGSKHNFNSSGANKFSKIRWQENQTPDHETFTEETHYQALIPSSPVMLKGVIVLYGDDSYGINFDTKGATSDIALRQAETCKGTACYIDPHAPSRPRSNPSGLSNKPSDSASSQNQQEALQTPEGRYCINKDFKALAKEILSDNIYGDEIAEKLMLITLTRYTTSHNKSPLELLQDALDIRIGREDSQKTQEVQDRIKGMIRVFCMVLKQEYANRELTFTDANRAAPLIKKYLE